MHNFAGDFEKAIIPNASGTLKHPNYIFCWNTLLHSLQLWANVNTFDKRHKLVHRNTK